jgi:hypothetical protein
VTDRTARAIASLACCAGCTLIAFAEPGYGVLCILGMVGGLYVIWDGV